MSRGKIWIRRIFFSALILVGGVFSFNAIKGRQVEIEQENAVQRARASAEDIPADERAVWIASLDRALSKVSVYRGYVQYRTIEGIIFEPISAAKVACDPIFGIRFGETLLVSYRNLLGMERMPPLSVGNKSPAAVKLMLELCHRTIDALHQRAVTAKE